MMYCVTCIYAPERWTCQPSFCNPYFHIHVFKKNKINKSAGMIKLLLVYLLCVNLTSGYNRRCGLYSWSQ